MIGRSSIMALSYFRGYYRKNLFRYHRQLARQRLGSPATITGEHRLARLAKLRMLGYHARKARPGPRVVAVYPWAHMDKPRKGARKKFCRDFLHVPTLLRLRRQTRGGALRGV